MLLLLLSPHPPVHFGSPWPGRMHAAEAQLSSSALGDTDGFESTSSQGVPYRQDESLSLCCHGSFRITMEEFNVTDQNQEIFEYVKPRDKAEVREWDCWEENHLTWGTVSSIRSAAPPLLNNSITSASGHSSMGWESCESLCITQEKYVFNTVC